MCSAFLSAEVCSSANNVRRLLAPCFSFPHFFVSPPRSPLWRIGDSRSRTALKLWHKNWKMTDLGLGLHLCASFLPKSSLTSLPLLKSSFFRIPSLVVARIEPVRRINNQPNSYSKSGKKEHHLWMKRDSTGSGQKALHLVRIVSKLPNEKEDIYGALDKWTAWETEFPVIAAAKALEILRRRNQWLRVIQVSKWLLSKGQVLTMGTYDSLLLAFERDGRLKEAEELWSLILQRHTRSVSKRLFSRMIALYDHYHVSEKVVEVFADMEELGVRPDADTVKRVAVAFGKLGEFEKRNLVLSKYRNKWKCLHFNGERVRIRAEEC